MEENYSIQARGISAATLCLFLGKYMGCFSKQMHGTVFKTNYWMLLETNAWDALQNKCMVGSSKQMHGGALRNRLLDASQNKCMARSSKQAIGRLSKQMHGMLFKTEAYVHGRLTLCLRGSTLQFRAMSYTRGP